MIMMTKRRKKDILNRKMILGKLWKRMTILYLIWVPVMMILMMTILMMTILMIRMIWPIQIKRQIVIKRMEETNLLSTIKMTTMKLIMITTMMTMMTNMTMCASSVTDRKVSPVNSLRCLRISVFAMTVCIKPWMQSVSMIILHWMIRHCLGRCRDLIWLPC